MYPSDTDGAMKKRRLNGHAGTFALFDESRDAILRAFKRLRSQNIRTRANFWCCGSCASAAIDSLDTERKKKGLKPYDGAVYWHRQSEEGFRESGSVYVYFCVEAKFDKDWKDLDPEGTTRRCTTLAQKLVAALKAEDLDVEWDGNTGTAVLVDGFTEKYWKERKEKAEFKENVNDAYGIQLGSGL